MMKKNLVILAAILALTAFGTVSSVQAFIDPVTLTIILGVTMIVTVTAAEIVHNEKVGPPEKQAIESEEKDAVEEGQSAARVLPG
jgi:hypothetical protein